MPHPYEVQNCALNIEALWFCVNFSQKGTVCSTDNVEQLIFLC